MKKAVLILILLQSICIYSQEKKTYLSIQENNIFGSWDESWGCNIQLNKINTLNIGAGFELNHSKYQFIGDHTYTLESDGAWAGYLVYVGLSF